MHPDPTAHALDSRSPGHLLQDLAWLRRLATALVGSSGADDLVQETFEVALSHGETVREVRPFLAVVARRLARGGRRGERRRKQRERSVARAETAPSQDELVERADLARVVLEELHALPPVRQRVVMLRYLEGLEPTEIARLEHVRPSTVRANLSRGLAELRERLDQRSGGRDAWCMVLVPWLESDSGVRLMAAGATPATLLGGLTLMSNATLGKLSMILALPLAGFALWKSLEVVEPSTPTAAAVVVEEPRLEELASHALVPQELDVRRTPGAAPAPSPEGRDELALAPVTPTRLVDGITGEAVPAFTVVLRAGDDIVVTSNAEGDIAPPAQEGRSSVVLLEEERHGVFLTRRAERFLPWPLPSSLEVHVGPTFRLASDLPEGLPTSAFRARFESGGTHELEHSTTVRMDGSDLPWVRFPFAVTTAAGDGPWSLYVFDDEGHWEARAEVTRKAGIEVLPVPISFTGTGAARFAVSRARAEGSQMLGMELENVRTGETHRVSLNSAPGSQRQKGHARHLEPGTYAWHLDGQSGSFEVEVGRTTPVELQLQAPDPATTFDATVRLDLSAGSEIDPAGVRAFVVCLDQPDRAFSARPVPDPTGGPGSWKVELQDLALGEWQLVPVFFADRLRFEPRAAVLTPGGGVPTLALVDLGEMVPVQVRVVGPNGQPLLGAEVLHDTGGAQRTLVNPDGRGGLMPAKLPGSTLNRLHVRAPGHRVRLLFHRPETDGREVEVSLEPGWSNAVFVLDRATYEPVAGARVLVNGTDVGATDQQGLLEITGEGPPEALEVQSPGREVSGGPAEPLELDPLGGWVFLTRALP